MAEHLGLEDVLSAQPCRFIDDQLGDPCCDKNYTELWLETAKKNTAVCNQYFLEQPANHHYTVKVERTQSLSLVVQAEWICASQMYEICRDIADHEIKGERIEHQKKVDELDSYQHHLVSKGKLKAKNKLVVQSRQERAAALDRIQGHLYEYPIFFLNEDLIAGELKPAFGDAEGVLPAKTFT